MLAVIQMVVILAVALVVSRGELDPVSAAATFVALGLVDAPWTLAAGRLFGMRPTLLSIGSGPRLLMRRIGLLSIELRLLPLASAWRGTLVHAGDGARRWVGIYAVELALPAAVAVGGLAQPRASGWHSAGAAAAGVVAVGLLPVGRLMRFQTRNLTTFLLDLRTMTPERRAALALRPELWDLSALEETGQLAAAEALLERLMSQPGASTDRHLLGAACGVYESTGRYADAVAVHERALELAGPPGDPATLRNLAGEMACAVEAGQLPAARTLTAATLHLDAAERAGADTAMVAGPRAVLLLLAGAPEEAQSWAQIAVDAVYDPVSLADELCTLARCHLALGALTEATECVERARAAAPWWPRVASTAALVQSRRLPGPQASRDPYGAR